MNRISGESFGFGAHGGCVQRITPIGLKAGNTPSNGCCLAFSWRPTAEEFLATLRRIQPAFTILPNCSAYSHLGAAVWASAIPSISLPSLDQIQDNLYAVADLEEGILFVSENSAEEALLRSLALDLSRRDKAPAAQPASQGRVAIYGEISPGDDALAVIRSGADEISILKAEQFLHGDGGSLGKFVKWANASIPPANLLLRFFDLSLDAQTGQPCMSAPLGYRGVRALEVKKDLWEKFRELLGGLSGIRTTVILPMVTNVDEVIRFRELIGDIGVGVGITVETPAAALQIGDFLEVVEFVEIGLNDLTQYTMAWDRDIPHAERLPTRQMAKPIQEIVSRVTEACARSAVTCVLGLDLRPSSTLASQLISLRIRAISCAPILVPHWRALFGP